MKEKIKNKKWIIIYTFIIVLMCTTGQMGRLYDNTFKKYYTDSSIEYLDSSLEKSGNFFMTISGAKAIVAVIEGSHIGVNLVGQMAIEAGDIVQPLYDIIDLMWKGALLSLASVGIQKLAITYFPLKLLDTLLLIIMITWAPVYINSNFITNFTYRVSKFFLVITMTIYLLVPLSVYFSARTSDYLYENYQIPVERQLQIKINELPQIRQRIEALYSGEPIEKTSQKSSIFELPKPKEKFDDLVKEVKSIIYSIELLTESILKLGVTLITMYLVDAILLPLLLMFMIYMFIKIVILGELKVVKGRNFSLKERIN